MSQNKIKKWILQTSYTRRCYLRCRVLIRLNVMVTQRIGQSPEICTSSKVSAALFSFQPQ